jgi:chromosome segregation ATPase
MNHEVIEARIRELKDNYQAGQTQLRSLEAQQKDLQQTLLRISGAIQALQELQELLDQMQGKEPDVQPNVMHLAR